MQELPGWGLVNVLLDRDELSASGPQLEHQVGVVAPVTGESVDLVEDDIVNVAGLLDEGEHPLKLTPVGGLGALAPVNEYRDHLSVEGFGLAAAGVLLCGQRVAVGVVVLVGLF
ncbi:MAG TPA: hypothetical protein VGL06_26255 [Pseudonocardiaceae bacterium]